MSTVDPVPVESANENLLSKKFPDKIAEVHTNIDSGVDPNHSGPGPSGLVPAASLAIESTSVFAKV